ncbi:hypothetical protein J7I98_23520 [Streptomyces sp. ISL-98]|uniref:hypothetical protein n=1 Tax=Streptomyces sp. ISL-98 TaxID=2819192 RepID=UPI001BEC7EB6|nr:hypothetical protein [Streptomyces sp. ISL-98]MBT2508800.1 hypothetical protein [Streptomyces sp. ISL-98]
MGFRKKTKPVVLTFEGDPDLDGLEVHVRGKSLGEYLEIIGLTESDIDGPALVRQLEEFAKGLISWNLEEEDGTPVPPTRDAVFAQDKDMMLRVATRWFERLEGAVDAPLPESSPGGEPSPVASIPMETLPDHPAPTAVPA